MPPVTLAYDEEKNQLVVFVTKKETWKQREFKQIGVIKLDA